MKIEFCTEKGKGIRLMLEVLVEKGLLGLENRQKRAIYEALKLYFNRDIGSYQSIFDIKFIDKIDLVSVRAKVEFILKSMK